MNKKIGVVFGCNHGGYFAKFRIDVNTRFTSLDVKNDYYFFSYLNPTKTKKLFSNSSKFKDFINFKSYFDSNSWKESFAMLENIQNKYNFDRIIISFTPLINSFSLGNEEKIENLYSEILKDDKYGFGFSSMKNYYRRIMMLYYFTKILNVPITQFVDDPLECDLSKFNSKNNRYFFYNNLNKNLNYFPFAEWSFVYNGYIKQPKKEYDFVFGMTSIMSSNNFRPKLIDELLKIDSNHDLKLKLFFKDKQKKINTFVNGFEYNEYISKSRFTLNIPSYDVEEFSMERFLEAIKRNCVPLIHDQCKYKEPLSIYPSILEIVKKDCIVNTSNLVEKLTNIDDVSIINKLKASQDWKNINDLNYYNGYMKKYGEEIFYSDKVISDPYTDVLKKILEFSDEDISYNEKTYKILNSFKELYKNTKFSFNLTNIQILDENIEKFLIYNPFMFYYKKNKRKELMELYLKEIEKLSDEEKFLYGIGNGCTDDGCIIVLGMAPGFYNGTKYDLLSKPYKPSFYFSNTSKILRFGLSKHLDNIYFTNLSKIVYSKERMSNVEYSKLYEKYIQVFLEEIKILKPKQIIALGNNLNEILNKYNIEHITLKHPSYFLYRKNEHNGINYYEEEIKCLK